MSEEFLPSLFELFTRERNTTLSKIPGTGLGMAIVKNLVDLMNGSIEVESELGKGSTFTITIPHKIANKDYTNRNIESSHELDIDFKGKRILLAEDNELNAEIAIELLKEEGILTDRAKDGQECCDMLGQAEDGYYALILMDIQMPRLNGYEATAKIRQMENRKKAAIPIIAMTANAFQEDQEQCYKAGMNAHLTKPVNREEIIRVLAAYWKNKG